MGQRTALMELAYRWSRLLNFLARRMFVSDVNRSVEATRLRDQAARARRLAAGMSENDRARLIDYALELEREADRLASM
jgi:hypothetical protein